MHYPSEVPGKARELISRFLVSTPSTRLGTLRRGAADITTSSFFAGFSFERLYHKELPTPYVPSKWSVVSGSIAADEKDDDGANGNGAPPLPPGSDELFDGFRE